MRKHSAALSSVAVLLTLAPTASARVVEGQGIAGVLLGQSMAQVRQVAGRPSAITPCGRGCVNWSYHPTEFQGVVNFGRDRRVASMFSYSKQQRTAKGIGVGSSEAAIRRAYPRARCGRGPYGGRSRICTISGRYRGRAVETAFPMLSPRAGVKEMDVYFVTRAGA